VDDHIKRWMTSEGTFRILACQSTQMVAEAARLAGASPRVTEVYGRLLTGTALMQLAQSPIDRVQIALNHDGPAGQLLADVWPGPAVRGRIENPGAEDEQPISGNCRVDVSRQPARGGALYQSVVPVTDLSVAGALQQYTMESEQVLTLLSLVTTVRDDGNVAVAAGMIVQALPGWTNDHLQQVTACLEKASFNDLVNAGDSPFDAAKALFHTLGLHETGADPLVYRCRCSKQVALNAVLTLPPEELAEIRAGANQSVTCDFCSSTYEITASDLETE